MRERGIIFSAPMVRALLEGRKTQTRRIITPQPHRNVRSVEDIGVSTATGEVIQCTVPEGWNWRNAFAADGHDFPGVIRHHCPYGIVGQRLWVRETHAQFAVGNKTGDAPLCVAYRATCDGDSLDYVNNGDEIMRLQVTKWTPSIFMPRWASRIALEIVEVRAQRLQDITEDDAKAEGVEAINNPEGDCWTDGTHRSQFQWLWNEIHGWNPNAWEANPWVWAITFKRVTP